MEMATAINEAQARLKGHIQATSAALHEFTLESQRGVDAVETKRLEYEALCSQLENVRAQNAYLATVVSPEARECMRKLAEARESQSSAQSQLGDLEHANAAMREAIQAQTPGLAAQQQRLKEHMKKAHESVEEYRLRLNMSLEPRDAALHCIFHDLQREFVIRPNGESAVLEADVPAEDLERVQAMFNENPVYARLFCEMRLCLGARAFSGEPLEPPHHSQLTAL